MPSSTQYTVCVLNDAAPRVAPIAAYQRRRRGMQCSMPSSSQSPVRELKDPLEGLTITRTSRATDATGSSVRLRRAVGRRYTLHRPP